MAKSRRKRTNKRGTGYVGFDSIRKPTAKPSRLFSSPKDVNFRNQKYKQETELLIYETSGDS